MKKLKATRWSLPGKTLLILFSLVGFLGVTSGSAQTTPCVKIDFGFTVDNNTKTVKFEARTSSNALAVKWDFGDGDQGRGENVKHTYDSAGWYKVCATAYAFDSVNNTRCSTTVCKRINVLGCDLRAGFDSKVDDLSVKLEAKSNSKNAIYGWVFGDGNTARGKAVKHTYKKEDTYKICLIVKDTVTGCVTEVCKKIKVEDPCNLVIDFGLRKDDLSIKVEAKSNSKNVVYGWLFGDGESARGKEAKHTYKKEGKYEVCLIAKDTVTGCTARKCTEIRVEDPCKLEVAFDLQQDGLSFKAKGKSNSRNAVYGWTFGDGESARGQETKHTYDSAGKYTVCFIAKDTVTGCIARKCIEIKVQRPCKLEVDFEYGQDGNDVKFRAKANQNGVRFLWTFGDGTTATGSTAKHTYKKPGVYEVCVKAISASSTTNTAVCTAKACKRVVVKKDQCTLKADFKYEISGKKIRVKAEANEKGVLYYWSFGDNTSNHMQSARHRYDKYGVYEVCLIVFNPKTKCKVCICKKIVIEKPCRLRADFKYRVNKNVVTFKARSNSKNVVYGWTFGDGTSQRGNPLRHKYTKAGTYKVTLIAKDTVTGCLVSQVKRIIINPRKGLAPAPPLVGNNSENSANELTTPDVNWTAQAYPVPSTTQVAFTADKDISSVKVFNTAGNELITSELSDSSQRIDISTLPTGYYFAHLTAADGSVKIVKFVKN